MSLIIYCAETNSNVYLVLKKNIYIVLILFAARLNYSIIYSEKETITTTLLKTHTQNINNINKLSQHKTNILEEKQKLKMMCFDFTMNII